MVKVAIPYWHGRISPVFDVARQLAVFEIDENKAQQREDIELTGADFRTRAMQLAQTGARVLICGAISWPLEMLISSMGIQVMSQNCGDIDQVLTAFMNGQLARGGFLMPGCCRRQNRFRGRHGRGCGERWVNEY